MTSRLLNTSKLRRMRHGSDLVRRTLEPRHRQFLLQLRSDMMEIGNLTPEQATQLIRSSGIFRDLRRNSDYLMHENPAYFAFALTYRGDKDWLEAYEDFIIIRRRKNAKEYLDARSEAASTYVPKL